MPAENAALAMLAPSKLFCEGDEDGGEGHGDVRVAADEGESILGGWQALFCLTFPGRQVFCFFYFFFISWMLSIN